MIDRIQFTPIHQLLDENVASNIAQNLMDFIHDDADANTTPRNTKNTQNNKAIDPDEDEERLGYDEVTKDNEYRLDEMLIETVTAHKNRESRTDFVESKLHELFPQNDDDGNTEMLKGGGLQDMSVIASNLVSYLHDDPPSNDLPPNNGKQKAKARGSTDLSDLQKQIDELKTKVNGLESDLVQKEMKNNGLNDRVNELEEKNHSLMKEIQILQNSKTSLALQSTKCIDELRDVLLCYQKCMGLQQ